MDQLYSIFLLLALVFGGIGIISAVSIALSKLTRLHPLPKAKIMCLAAGSISLVFGIISAWIHRIFGHGSDSLEPMSLAQFFSHHTAYWFVLVLTLSSFSGYLYLRQAEADISAHR